MNGRTAKVCPHSDSRSKGKMGSQKLISCGYILSLRENLDLRYIFISAASPFTTGSSSFFCSAFFSSGLPVASAESEKNADSDFFFLLFAISREHRVSD